MSKQGKLCTSGTEKYIEKSTVSICQAAERLRYWSGLQTLIRVQSERKRVFLAIRRSRFSSGHHEAPPPEKYLNLFTMQANEARHYW